MNEIISSYLLFESNIKHIHYTFCVSQTNNLNAQNEIYNSKDIKFDDEFIYDIECNTVHIMVLSYC